MEEVEALKTPPNETEPLPGGAPGATPSEAATPSEVDLETWFGRAVEAFGVETSTPADPKHLDALTGEVGQKLPDAARGFVRTALQAGQQYRAKLQAEREAERAALAEKERALAEREAAAIARDARLQKLFGGSEYKALLSEAEKPDSEMPALHTEEGIRAYIRREAGRGLKDFHAPLAAQAEAARQEEAYRALLDRNPELADKAVMADAEATLARWRDQAIAEARARDPKLSESDLATLGMRAIQGRAQDAVNATLAERARAAAAKERDQRRDERARTAAHVHRTTAPTRPNPPTIEAEIERLKKLDDVERAKVLFENPDLARRIEEHRKTRRLRA